MERRLILGVSYLTGLYLVTQALIFGVYGNDDLALWCVSIGCLFVGFWLGVDSKKESRKKTMGFAIRDIYNRMENKKELEK